jgi:ribulose-5-phosphate 4-epimerase/fuculose-1-phosphate aldolase
MLRNHGLLTVGGSIADAFLAMYMFETTCQIQLSAQAGGELIRIEPATLQRVAEAQRVQTRGQGGAFVWPTLLRRVQRADPDYNT